MEAANDEYGDEYEDGSYDEENEDKVANTTPPKSKNFEGIDISQKD